MRKEREGERCHPCLNFVTIVFCRHHPKLAFHMPHPGFCCRIGISFFEFYTKKLERDRIIYVVGIYCHVLPIYLFILVLMCLWTLVIIK